MAVQQKSDVALELSRLTFPASLPVVRVEVQDYTDATGEASLRVLVVLDERVDLNHISGRDVGELKWTIREHLRARGFSEFAYIFLAQDSEISAGGDEE